MAKTIDDYKKDYAAARARGDAAGMQAANDGANAIRRAQGQAEERADVDIAKFKTPTTTPVVKKTTSGQGSQTLWQGGLKPTGSLGTSPGGETMTPQQVLSQGKGPQNVPLSGGQKQTSVTQSPEYQALADQLGRLQQQTQRQDDYSDYVRQLQEAARAKSLAELEAAYQKNVNAIDAAKGQIAPQYTEARNQVAGQAAVSRKNWQEQAAAMGLNSGAAGQSDIAMNLARQNALAELDRGESADLAALELQRTQATTDYNSAIAQAQASGDYELAAALYQEKVRADEAKRADQATQFQQMLQKMQFEYGMSQDALAQQNWELQRQDALEQQGWNNRFQESEAQASQQAKNFNNLLTLVSAYAESTGDYSLFSQFGFTPEQISAWNSAWASQNAPAIQQAYRKTSGGSGSGTGTGTGQGSSEPTMSLTSAKEMAKNGYFNDLVLETLRKNGYDDAAIYAIYGYEGGTQQPGAARVDEVSVDQLGLGPITPEYLEQLVQSGQVEEYMENGYLKFRWKQGQGGLTKRSPADVLAGRF